MSDEFVEPLHAALGTGAINAYPPPSQLAPIRPGLILRAHVIAVTHGRPHPGEQHQLDVTVGGEDGFTEILLRVPNGAYGHLEGRDGHLHIDPV